MTALHGLRDSVPAGLAGASLAHRPRLLGRLMGVLRVPGRELPVPGARGGSDALVRDVRRGRPTDVSGAPQPDTPRSGHGGGSWLTTS